MNASDLVLSDQTLNLIGLVPLVYGIPSMVIYVYSLAVLLRNFREPFYRLFGFCGVLDCLAWVFFYFTLRANHAPVFYPLYQALSPDGFIVDVWYIILGYFHFVQFLASFFLTFNRFSLLLLTVNYDKVWRKLVPISIVVSLVLPLALSYDAFAYGGQLVRETVGFAIYSTTVEAETRITLLTVVVALGNSIICGLMNLVTGIWFLFRRRKAQLATGTILDTRNAELRLYMLSLIVFLGGLLAFLIQMAFYVLHTNSEATPLMSLILTNTQMISFDLHMCTNPWLLMAMRTFCVLRFDICGCSPGLLSYINYATFDEFALNRTDVVDPSVPQVTPSDSTEWKPVSVRFNNTESIIKYHLMAPTTPDVCDGKSVLVTVPTRPSAFETRQAIRNSWAKEAGSEFLVRFLIGQNSSDNLDDALKSEQLKFDDLVLYDLPDTYENLYLKIHAAMSWQQTFCPDVEYWLKTDDDTVVDLKRLLHWILNQFVNELKSGRAAIFGTTWKGAKPYRNESHRWYVPKDVYDKNKWPVYFNGPTYLMTTEAVESILAHTAEVNAFRIEDILFTGVLAEAARVKKHNHARNFRLGSKLSKREPCDKHRVPYVLALYSFDTPAKLTDAYDRLHSIKCK